MIKCIESEEEIKAQSNDTERGTIQPQSTGGDHFDRRRMMGLDTFVGHLTSEEASGGSDDDIKVCEMKKSDGLKKHMSYKVMGKDA